MVGISPAGMLLFGVWTWRGGRVDEGSRLLSGYSVNSGVPGSNPGLSDILRRSAKAELCRARR